MAPALHVPRSCSICSRAWLAAGAGPTSACPHCGGPASALPGESYHAADVPLFLRIENAMCARPIANGVRHRLGATLSDVYQRSQRPARLLALVVDAIPELQFVQNELYRNPARVPQALGMIATVLRAQLRAPEAVSASDRDERASPVP